jgi:acyl-[acyl-carrier-protein]-phospholipid O-acyltransferase/long-chain-fatty-acid--[acyl-carrier-protein] ligase
MSVNSGKLLASKRFWGLCMTQACGAFNDNLVKNAALILAMFTLGHGGAGLSALAGGLFIAPYALLSATSGNLAELYPKHRLIFFAKIAEMLLMLTAGAGFLEQSIPLLLAVVFGLGVQAAVFSPLKFGIVPELLGEDEILAGNGLLEAFTFVAILIGTIAGGAVILLPHGGLLISLTGLIVAIVGICSAASIPAVQAATPSGRLSWRFLSDTVAVVRDARRRAAVWQSILGLSWFWTVGAILLTEFPVLARDVLKSDGHLVSLFLTVFALGVGIGSAVCSKLLKGEVSARYVPAAAFGISIFCWDFASSVASAGHLSGLSSVASTFHGWRMMADLLLLSACGGMFSVPLYAIIQERSPKGSRSRMIAANNILNAVFMVAGTTAAGVLAKFGMQSTEVLDITAVVNAVAVVALLCRYPHAVLGAVMRFYFRAFHGAAVTGLENVAKAGKRVVVVVNHQSFLDGCFVAAFFPGRPVFAVDVGQAQRFWFLRYVLDIFPVSPTNPMAVKTMIGILRNDKHLVIFPEGRITVTGALMKLYGGPGMIADRAGAAILPVRIDGLQFHKASRMQGKLPLRWFPRFTMTIHPPVFPDLPSEVSGKARKNALAALVNNSMVEAALRPAACGKTLFAALLHARSHYDMGKAILAEMTQQDSGAITLTELGYKRLILAAIVLGHKFSAMTRPGDYVGVMLPNAVGAVVTFFALQSQARVPAMINFSAGTDGMLSACRTADVKLVLTSRKFIAKAKLEKQAEALSGVVTLVYLEDIRAAITVMDKVRGKLASLRAHLLPGSIGSPDDTAVVLFTSGSEGNPKGVALSHRNLLSNCQQAAAVVDFNPGDRVLNALPMFHSFGLTAGTLLPLLHGVRTFLYPSPLHYKQVPEMVYADQSTIMFGTDSFLTGYARKGDAADFQSLRYIFAGAERVRPETRATYMAHFKKPIFEGYGATETSPIITLETYTHSRPGTVGRMMPGMGYRIEPIPGITDGGRLYVCGPNIMKGYLKQDRPGVIQPPEGGWYDTGDIVSKDDDGYWTIKGRAKRFAKIAGEMVSLSAAEGLLSRLWPGHQHVVVALPDTRKGQRLLLVTTDKDASIKALLAFARENGVAELMVPRALLVVDAIPLLGTGKVNYPAVEEQARSSAPIATDTEVLADA